MGLFAGLLLGLISGAIRSVIQRKAAWSLKRIGIFAVAGTLLGAVIALMIPDQFVSTAVLRVGQGTNLQQAISQVLSETSLEAIIRQEGLYDREVKNGGMAQAVSRMRNKAVRVQAINGTLGKAFTVSFLYGDRAVAQRVTGKLVKSFTAVIPEVQTLDPASDPPGPISPHRLTIALMGAFLGILLGLAATRFRRPAAAAA
jgi:LPS O-antigen subunit length determinant protein (WzzB/FepE family)